MHIDVFSPRNPTNTSMFDVFDPACSIKPQSSPLRRRSKFHGRHTGDPSPRRPTGRRCRTQKAPSSPSSGPQHRWTALISKHLQILPGEIAASATSGSHQTSHLLNTSQSLALLACHGMGGCPEVGSKKSSASSQILPFKQEHIWNLSNTSRCSCFR